MIPVILLKELLPDPNDLRQIKVRETGEAIIGFDIESGSPAKKHLLDVELRGIDENEEVVIFRRTVPLVVQESPEEIALSSFGLAAISLLTGTICGAFYFRNCRHPD